MNGLKWTYIWVATIPLLLLSCGKKATESNSQAAVSGSAPVDYSTRIGVAVRTSSRTCVAIRNGAVPVNSPLTLVVPVSPQSVVEAQISGPSPGPCPITEEVAPEMSNYEISLPTSSNIPNLIPLVAVIGTAASSSFLLENAGVQADLDQTHAKNTFRACGANDGVHLTVWHGIPVDGTRLWAGYCYEAGNPGTLPTCTTAELAECTGSRLIGGVTWSRYRAPTEQGFRAPDPGGSDIFHLQLATFDLRPKRGRVQLSDLFEKWGDIGGADGVERELDSLASCGPVRLRTGQTLYQEIDLASMVRNMLADVKP